MRYPVDFAIQILARNLQWIAAADGKVGPNLAIATAMFGILAAIVPGAATRSVIFLIAAATAALFLMGTIASLALAVFPRLSGSSRSLVFFGGIAQYDCDTYVQRLDSATADELFDDLGRQIHRNAEIAQTKHRHVRRGMAFLFLSVIPWLISVSLYYSQQA
jgi:hypothetical protein